MAGLAARAAAARRADHGPRPPALAAALPRAGRRRAPRGSRATATSSGACGSAIAFADLAGYTRLTEEAGEEEALDVVERFVEPVEETLPDDARVIKTIGDEVMVVGADPSALADWAVGFQALSTERAAAADRPALRRRAVPRRRLLRPRGQPRLARRRARGRRRGAGHARGRARRPARTWRSSRSARCKLKGFDEATELFLARAGDEAERTLGCGRPGCSAGSSCRAAPAGATRSACSTSRSRLAAAGHGAARQLRPA